MTGDLRSELEQGVTPLQDDAHWNPLNDANARLCRLLHEVTETIRDLTADRPVAAVVAAFIGGIFIGRGRAR
ncbi:hypothetical protein AA101099_2780 [Neoasaia chiangmaiensis NBRC 101099]|uniref:Uncharacterized protein n=1 Tax=Neoasaia chiangmaiensis TaxID=320497 RepID=A0A1U9KP56_9PROT|nr:hypothetical protein [Neoasaia chiangmaiensis]AQS87584.1 hypothetical protein A0U93_06155 [Neoasaia chiangmaiensis]GBR42179.1 hypothetical protein AA101099_2780 [Neoasaia chiangmaiensis NBRC 101099]GEN14143.1 hypothetical protein NCH01_05740 [Neoasaia chiangmaiensis]